MSTKSTADHAKGDDLTPEVPPHDKADQLAREFEDKSHERQGHQKHGTTHSEHKHSVRNS